MGETFFQRLESQLDGLKGASDDVLKYVKYMRALRELRCEAFIEDISLTTQEVDWVREAALEHLQMGDKSQFLILCDILAYTGTRSQREATDTLLTLYPYLKDGCTNPNDIAIDLLHIAGVFESGEEVLYHDNGVLGVQKKDVGRTGLVILTNRRIVAVGGFFEGFGSKWHRLFYGDLREPYLSTVDFVYLDRMEKIELKKDKIQAKYDTEYIVEKERTFYGPYFFKFDLPTSVKVKSGTVKVFVYLWEMDKIISKKDRPVVSYFEKAISLWKQVQLPADYDRSRVEEFHKRILTLMPV